MNNSSRRMLFSGFSFWLVVVGVLIYFMMPLRYKDRWKQHLGIDLIGGSYLTLEVQTDEAVKSELLGVLQGVSKKLKDAKKVLPKRKIVEDGKITLTFEDLNAAQSAAMLLKSEPGMKVSASGTEVFMKFTEGKENRIKTEAVQNNIEVFRTRLSNLRRVAEITIAAQGEKNIVIELPGVTDPMQARALIGKPAILEFKLVERSDSTPENIKYEYDGQIPDDMEILPGKAHEDGSRRYYLVPRYTDITGKLLRDARSGMGGTIGIEHLVSFKFSSQGGDRFYDLTSRNFGRHLAVVLDGEVIMAARIESSISTEGVIKGLGSSEEARELAILLRSGGLTAPITIEGDNQIGATLGASSIKSGLYACLIGLGLLLVFSIFYYSLSGLFAFIALLYNLCLVLFGLYALGAVLTLPGIAGMVLTVGMAIDASILIYERIKDALAEGLTVKNAVNTGFSNAMVVILDANITTFIVGVVLYKFGTGPLQGFAVTMMLGIISTLVTGLFFLRSLFNFVLDNFNVQKLRI